MATGTRNDAFQLREDLKEHSHGCLPNVDMNRPKGGAAPASQETCLTKGPVPVIGSAISS